MLAIVLAVLRWDDASKLAAVLSALAGVAAVGVAVWAGLPRRGGEAQPRGSTTLSVTGTGNATAGPGGRANTGIVAAAGALPDDVRVERTGHADASGGGEADSGARLD